MASIAAQEVAKEVIRKVRKGERPVLRKIIPKHGYGPSIADHPNKVTGTDSYKDIVNPIVNEWLKERERLTKSIMGKDLDKVHYKDAIDALDKLNKNIQLLTGGATENFAVIASVEERESINKALDAIA